MLRNGPKVKVFDEFCRNGRLSGHGFPARPGYAELVFGDTQVFLGFLLHLFPALRFSWVSTPQDSDVVFRLSGVQRSSAHVFGNNLVDGVSPLGCEAKVLGKDTDFVRQLRIRF